MNVHFHDSCDVTWFPLYLKLGFKTTPRLWKSADEYKVELGLLTGRYHDVVWVLFGLQSPKYKQLPNIPATFYSLVNEGIHGLDYDLPSNVHNLPDPQFHLAKVAKTPKNVQAAVFDGVSWPRELRSGALIPSSSSAAAAAAASQEDDDDGDKETPPPPADHAAATTLADVLHFLDHNDSSHSVGGINNSIEETTTQIEELKSRLTPAALDRKQVLEWIITKAMNLVGAHPQAYFGGTAMIGKDCERICAKSDVFIESVQVDLEAISNRQATDGWRCFSRAPQY